MLHSQESGSSVFYQSQEGPGPDSRDCPKSLEAPFNLRQAKDARSSSGDSATNPG